MKILVLGDLIIDHYLTGIINRQSPEDETVSVVDVEKEEYMLGGAGNVASNLKSLEPQNNVCVSSIVSEFTARLMDGKHVDYKCCYFVKNSDHFKDYGEFPSKYELVKTRIVSTEKQLLRVDNRLKFDKMDLKLWKNICFNQIHLSDYDAIVISDYQKGIVDEYVV
ncbi:MAG: hypothetical protein AABY22_37050, partial [Nanoarchaeota archaeon]